VFTNIVHYLVVDSRIAFGRLVCFFCYQKFDYKNCLNISFTLIGVMFFFH